MYKICKRFSGSKMKALRCQYFKKGLFFVFAQFWVIALGKIFKVMRVILIDLKYQNVQ